MTKKKKKPDDEQHGSSQAPIVNPSEKPHTWVNVPFSLTKELALGLEKGAAETTSVKGKPLEKMDLEAFAKAILGQPNFGKEAGFLLPENLMLNEDPLDKAIKSTHKVNYGSWNGLPIVAIGPKGGKIVGYTAKGKPIYAGTPEGTKLAGSALKVEHTDSQKTLNAWKNWFGALEIKFAVVSGNAVITSSDAKHLQAAFGVQVHGDNGVTAQVALNDLKPFLGQAFKPSPEQHLEVGAAAASGESDHAQAPAHLDLKSLVEIPAGDLAGSHGNRLFKAKDGTRYIFKAKNETISRAEEAASRLGALLLPGKVQEAKYVKLGDKDGVLIRVFDGGLSLGPEHKVLPPPTAKMQKHFDDIVQQHALDWLISNHDAHGDNFLVTKDGVVGIDKGQAWKYVGDDELDVDYNPNASTQAYSFFWKQVQSGQIKGDPVPALQAFFQRLSQISDEQFKAIVAPYVAVRTNVSGELPSYLEAKLVKRFADSKSNWEWFLGKVYGKDKVEIPTSNTPAPQAAEKLVLDGSPEVLATKKLKNGQTAVLKKVGEAFLLLTSNPDGTWLTQPAPAISTAADMAWAIANGYESVKDYEKKTGKKVPPGGKKFWGLHKDKVATAPVKAVVADPVKVKAPAAPATGGVTSDEWKVLKTPQTISLFADAPEGTMISWNATDSKAYEATKYGDAWVITSLASGHDLGPSTSDVVKNWVNVAPDQELAIKYPAKEHPVLAVDQVSTAETGTHPAAFAESDLISSYPTGTVVGWNTSLGPVVATKVKGDSWDILFGGLETPDWADLDISNFLKVGGMSIPKPADGKFKVKHPGPEASPPLPQLDVASDPNWETMPVDLEVHHFDSLPEGTVVKQKFPFNEIAYTKKGDNWVSAGSSPAGYSSEIMFADAGVGPYYVKKGTTFPKKTKSTVHTSLGDGLNFVDETTTKWATLKTTDGVHFLGEKPTGWPAWVPPPGVWVEGKDPSGKPLYFTTTMSGYGQDGTTALNVAFAFSDGKSWEFGNGAHADKAEIALTSALKGALPGDIFPGFLDNNFPAGTTKLDYATPKPQATDFGGAKPATSSNLATTPPAQPVSASVPLMDAWPDLPEVKQYAGKLKYKPIPGSPDKYWVVLDPVKGLSPEQSLQVLEDFVHNYGLKPTHKAKNNAFGSLITVKTSDFLAATASVVKPAKEISHVDLTPAPAPSPSQGSSEHPGKIMKSWKVGKKIQVLQELPVGSSLAMHNGKIYTKGKDSAGTYWSTELSSTKFPNVGIATMTGGGGALVYLPGQTPTPYAGAATKKATPKATWTPPPVDPQAAEKIQWAKEHPAVDSQVAHHVTWHLHKSGITQKVVVRQGKGGTVLVGDGTSDFGKTLGLPSVQFDTPHGPLFAVPLDALTAATPEATKIKGPDGAEYPYGTTFQEEKIYKTLEQLLHTETGFTKFSEYKGPEPAKYQKTVKYAGNQPQHKAMAEATIKKFGLQTPIIQGSGNTMFFVSADVLKGNAGEPEIKVTAKVPQQPPPALFKGVGAATGHGKLGQPAPTNRMDLSSVDSVIPPRHGYTIRFGTGGVLMDGQLRMVRVQLPDGSVVNRFYGELTRKPKALAGANLKFHYFSSSDSKPSELFSDLGWKENDYDPTTGVHKMTSKENWDKGPDGSSGKHLSSGAALYTFPKTIEGKKNKTQERTFVLDVPVGQDAEPALAEAMGTMGVPVADAMAHPTEADERIMKKIQLLRSHHASTGWIKIEAMDLLSKTVAEREVALDAALKGTFTKADVEKAHVVVGHDGYHHVELDDVDKYFGKEVLGIATHISVEGIARTIQQGGYGGLSQTLFTGNGRDISQKSGETASSHIDMLRGGGVGKFYRIIGKNVDKHTGVAQDKPYFVVHPRVLRKTNWYAANADTFGSQDGEAARGRRELEQLFSTSNEVMIENVDATDIVGAVVPTTDDRQKLLGYFKKMGLSEINGTPIEKFVVVGPTNTNLNSSISKLPALKEFVK